MFWKKKQKQTLQKGQQNLSLELLKEILANLEDAEIVERQKPEGQCFTFIYIRTLIDQERMNEALFEPLLHCTNESIQDCISTSKCPQPPSMSVIWPVALTVQLNNGHPQCHRHLQKTTWLSEFKKVHHGSALSIPS